MSPATKQVPKAAPPAKPAGRLDLGALGSVFDKALAGARSEQQAVGSDPDVILISPEKTRMNSLHRRLIAEETVKELLASIQASGQHQEAKGWRLKRPDDDGVEIILVYGARRRAACTLGNLKLLVRIIPQPSNGELIRMMRAENKDRRDYTAWEQAQEYQAYMEAGVYESTDAMIADLGDERSKVYRHLQLLRLPQEVLDSFKNKDKLGLVKGVELLNLIEDKPDVRSRVVAAAIDAQAKGVVDPMSLLLKAAKPVASGNKEKELYVPGGGKQSVLGTVRGASNQENGMLVLNLRPSAPPALKEEILQILRKHARVQD